MSQSLKSGDTRTHRTPNGLRRRCRGEQQDRPRTGLFQRCDRVSCSKFEHWAQPRFDRDHLPSRMVWAGVEKVGNSRAGGGREKRVLLQPNDDGCITSQYKDPGGKAHLTNLVLAARLNRGCQDCVRHSVVVPTASAAPANKCTVIPDAKPASRLLLSGGLGGFREVATRRDGWLNCDGL